MFKTDRLLKATSYKTILFSSPLLSSILFFIVPLHFPILGVFYFIFFPSKERYIFALKIYFGTCQGGMVRNRVLKPILFSLISLFCNLSFFRIQFTYSTYYIVYTWVLKERKEIYIYFTCMHRVGGTIHNKDRQNKNIIFSFNPIKEINKRIKVNKKKKIRQKTKRSDTILLCCQPWRKRKRGGCQWSLSILFHKPLLCYNYILSYLKLI